MVSGLFLTHSPSNALHSFSSIVTRPDGSDSAVLPPSPSSSLLTFLYSSLSCALLPSFSVLLLAHLSCGCLFKLCVLSYWVEMTSVKMTCTYLTSQKRTDGLSIDSIDKSHNPPNPLHKHTHTHPHNICCKTRSTLPGQIGITITTQRTSTTYYYCTCHHLFTVLFHACLHSVSPSVDHVFPSPAQSRSHYSLSSKHLELQ